MFPFESLVTNHPNGFHPALAVEAHKVADSRILSRNEACLDAGVPVGDVFRIFLPQNRISDKSKNENATKHAEAIIIFPP
jgi:hypothetical protein